MNVSAERYAVHAGIEALLTPAVREAARKVVNPYGDGHAAERITTVLAAAALDEHLLTKRFSDR